MATDSEIVELHRSGLTYKEVAKLTGACLSRIAGLVKGMRSHSEAGRLAFSRGRIKSQDSATLSSMARKACIASRKFWTKPEQKFRILLNECGLGVKFPPGLAEVVGEEEDADPTIHYQYAIQRYLCDFVDLGKRVVYRVNGDYWHANPLLYADTLTKPQQHNREQDRRSRIYLEKHGWKPIDMWESDIYWRPEEVKKIILAVRDSQPPPPGEAPNGQVEWQTRLNSLWHRKPRTKRAPITRNCPCGNSFLLLTKRDVAKRKYCSCKCSETFHRPTEWPAPEQLDEDLRTLKTRTAVAAKYGVSGRTIAKWISRILT